MSVKGIIFNIQRFSVHDGPGIRTTVFLKGCPLDCWWCHNPEGRYVGLDNKNGNSVGKEYSVDEVMVILEKDRIFYDESGGGVTFSGGEPLSQTDFLFEVLKRCKHDGIKTAVDTSGYSSKESFEKIIPFTDLVLFDLKIIDNTKHKKFTDVENHIILSNFEFVLKKAKRVIVRFPLIPGITMTTQNIDKVINYLKKTETKPEVNILPFHRIAEGKYLKNGFTNRMAGASELPESEIADVLALIKKFGFEVSIG
ncbi:MAG: glycyl-radical enzyme activating protein [Bacteroidales bacterium]